MPRYVDAEKELAEMKFAWYPQDMDTTNAIGMYENFLKNAPSADVAPVVHAHWERHFKRPGVYEDLWWHCSNCNGRTSEEYAPYWWSYCPYCGAKMDEEVE